MLRKLNLPLLILPITIFAFGLITLLSTSAPLVRNHLIFFIIGFFIYIGISFLDYSTYKYLWKVIYWTALALLFFTFFYAELRSGAARWLQLGPLSFQTSEFAKIALIVALSAFITEAKRDVSHPITLGGLAFILIPMSVLIFLQPDLGTVIVLIAIFLGVLFFSGIKNTYIIVSALLLGIFSAPLWQLLKDYQKERILVFLNPQLDVLGSGYNVIQSLIAVGSGGLLGKGFGRGTQANLQFLPAYWTDFIFASFAEEWGLLGVFLLVSFYAALLFTLLYIAFKARERFGMLLTMGIFMVFFVQFLVNVGMNMGLMPVTGVTLPLVSYGGSSILFSLVLLGIVQNIWINR